MIAFLIANIGNILVILILIAVVGLIVKHMIKNKKSGRSACGCGCDGCSGKCH